MASIQHQSYQKILNDVHETASNHGRNPEEILVLAVSKGHTWQECLPLYQAGCRAFGENRLEEALSKKADAPPNTQWHFIGSLQSNKVAKTIGQFSLIHSVDTPELCLKLAKASCAREVVTSVLLQVNTSGEKTKRGLSVEQWLEKIEALRNLRGIEIKGLMTIAALTKDQSIVRKNFETLRLFRDRLRDREGFGNINELSMGMSDDYRLAIAEGATILRIGRALWYEPR